MLHEPHFWKKVKCAWHNLFMSAYFGDSLYKKDIGVLFIKNYSAVFRSVYSFTVFVYKSPVLVKTNLFVYAYLISTKKFFSLETLNSLYTNNLSCDT